MASKIKVDQLETADGTGTIALQNQLSGLTTASLPTVTTDKLGTGAVLQVVYASISTAVTTSSSTFSDIGITASITPTSASNHIYVEWFAPDNRKETGATNLGMKIYRQVNGGGYSSIADVLGGWGWTNSNVTFSAGSSSIFKDTTHNSTNQIDYKLYIQSGQNAAKVTINKDGKSHTGIRLMEIKA